MTIVVSTAFLLPHDKDHIKRRFNLIEQELGIHLVRETSSVQMIVGGPDYAGPAPVFAVVYWTVQIDGPMTNTVKVTVEAKVEHLQSNFSWPRMALTREQAEKTALEILVYLDNKEKKNG